MALPSPPLNDNICMFASGVCFLANVVHGSPFISTIHMICMHTKYSFINHLNDQYFAYQLPCHRFNAHNDRDNYICEICVVLVDWGTSVVLSVSMKMGDIVWFGTHITINFGMKMGEDQIQQYT